MPSNYTANYQLNQWEPDDAVRRVDFNADNAKIDAAIKAVDRRVDGKVSTSALNSLQSTVNSLSATVSGQGTTLNHKGNCQVELSTYTGNGQETRTHTFPRKPLFFFIFGDVQVIVGYGSTLAYSLALDLHGVDTVWSGNSVSFTGRSSSTSNYARVIANLANVKYYMLTFYDQSV